jgi:hypothetical protein
MSAYDPIVNVGTAMQRQQGLVLFLLCYVIQTLYRFWREYKSCATGICARTKVICTFGRGWTESTCDDSEVRSQQQKKIVFVHNVFSINGQLSMCSFSTPRARFRPSIVPLPQATPPQRPSLSTGLLSPSITLQPCFAPPGPCLATGVLARRL